MVLQGPLGMGRKKGKLIVFEGADGSGKTTQAKLLYKLLKKNKTPAEFISFPIYESTWGKLVRKYLDGDFGDVNDVSPYLASVFYAGDRLAASKKLFRWLKAGKIIVCDRYTGSNIAHQAAKIKEEKERIRFIDWLEKFEYDMNKIPKENKVILLLVPIDFSQKLMRSKKKDIHEKDESYLVRVAKVYIELEEKRDYWEKVECIEEKSLLTPIQIHKKVLEIL